MSRKKFIAVCTPTLGRVSAQWALAYANLGKPYNLVLAPFLMVDRKGGEIAEVRNELVEKCFRTETATLEWEGTFWLDDDVLPARSALQALYEHWNRHKRPVASGVYFMKEPDATTIPLIFPGRVGGSTPFVPNRVVETWGWSHGLSFVHSSVYRTIRERGVGKDKYGRDEFYKTTCNAFGELKNDPDDPGVTDCGGTEDTFFFELVREAGFKPVVDTGKHAFGFHFDLERLKGYPEKQWAQATAGKAVTWDTPDGEVSWE